MLTALERGAHKSAYEYLEFVREEFADFVKKKFWVILPASQVLHLPGLRLIPLSCAPQHERRPRLICDYTYFGVNQDTDNEAPPEAMQFGHTLRRVLQKLAGADPKNGPVYLGKFDLKDGFYRMRLTPESVLPLGVLLPVAPAESPMIAFPYVDPMGWKESPPSFSAATETIADLANASLETREPLPSHRLEQLAATLPADHSERPDQMRGPMTTRAFAPDPLAYADVYVDDIIGMAQGTPEERLLVTRAILHSVDKVF